MLFASEKGNIYTFQVIGAATPVRIIRREPVGSWSNEPVLDRDPKSKGTWLIKTMMIRKARPDPPGLRRQPGANQLILGCSDGKCRMYWLSKQGEVITDHERNQGEEGPIFTYPWTHPLKDIEEKLKISPKDSCLNR